MLRPWSKPVTMVLAPEGMALHAAGEVRPLTSQTTSRSWEGLLTELAGMAAQLDLRQVRFVLSSQFVRYAVLPWQPGVLSSQDWRALGEHQMRKVFGVAADAWEIRVAPQAYAESAVVCAVDRLLLTRLEEIAAQHRWTIHGVEPALMAVFNRYRNEMASGDFWLLLAEPKRLVLAEVSQGQWRRFSVSSPPVGQGREECLAMVERAVRLEGKGRPARVYCFGATPLLPATQPEGVHFERLPSPERGENTTTLTMMANL